mgnify:CR=1 FL=1
MKYTIIIALLFSVTLFAGEKKSKKYGKQITVKEKTKISEIIANPEKYKGKKVLVEGMITNVCEKRGCWISIAGDEKYQTMKFKVVDGEIVFPVSEKGKNVIAQGTISVKTLSKEQQIEIAKEEAEEYGTPFDSTKITGEKIMVQLKGEGAEIR